MSEKTNQQIIDEYLKKVEMKLPIWLKDDKEQVKDIIEELENHIWDKATELAKGEDPNTWHIREAIDQMGTPKDISREYKRRGTPKFYITEELWPFYIRSVLVVSSIIAVINFIVMGFQIPDKGWQAVGQAFSGIWSGIFTAAIIITIIAVALSMEGLSAYT